METSRTVGVIDDVAAGIIKKRYGEVIYLTDTQYMTLLIYSDFKNQDTRHCG